MLFLIVPSLFILGFLYYLPKIRLGSENFFKSAMAVASPAALLFWFFHLCRYMYPFHLSQTDQLPLTQMISWSSTIGVDIVFRLDGLSLLFSLLITGVGAGVFVYAYAYMFKYPDTRGFFATLMFFTASMLGLVLSDHLIVTFIFWELTSLTSFLLIGFYSSQKYVQESARTALFVTVGGGLFLFVAILLIGLVGVENGRTFSEAMRISQLSSAQLVNSPLYPLIISGIAIAIATKSAQYPFHFWLPLAMVGPTPVSSFLHSATMVKAGVFLMAKLSPALSHHFLWQTIFVPMGALTMIVGAVLSCAHRDLKTILAYSTVCVLGTLVMLFGLGSPSAIHAALVYIVAHAFYKAALFQSVGTIDYSTNTRDLAQLNGLPFFLPLTSLTLVLSAASMAGLPPFLGFYAKESVFLSLMNEASVFAWIGLFLSVVASLFMVTVSFASVWYPFRKKEAAKETKIEVGEGEGFKTKSKVNKSQMRVMELAPFSLALQATVLGLMPFLFDGSIIALAGSEIVKGDFESKLKLWHGFDFHSLLAFFLSLFVLVGGALLGLNYLRVQQYTSLLGQALKPLSSLSWYHNRLAESLRIAEEVTVRLQTGDLRDYIRNCLYGILVYVLPVTVFVLFESVSFRLLDHVQAVDWLLAGSIFIPTVLVLIYRARLNQLALLSASGLAMVLSFSYYSALDLALTQLMVESLAILFMFFFIQSLPRNTGSERLSFGSWFGAGILSLLLLAMMKIHVVDLPQSVSDFYLGASYAQAFGKNIVNVILVDFRALDTFGEAIVIGIAAIGVGLLLGPKIINREDRSRRVKSWLR